MSDMPNLEAATEELTSLNTRYAQTFTVLVDEIIERKLGRAGLLVLLDHLVKVAETGELTRVQDSYVQSWVPLQLGDISVRVGAEVRVRPDKYAPSSVYFDRNGVEGFITAIRGGLVSIRYAGVAGGLETVERYEPGDLQVKA